MKSGKAVPSFLAPNKSGYIVGEAVNEEIGMKTYEYTNLPETIVMRNVLLTTDGKQYHARQ